MTCATGSPRAPGATPAGYRRAVCLQGGAGGAEGLKRTRLPPAGVGDKA